MRWLRAAALAAGWVGLALMGLGHAPSARAQHCAPPDVVATLPVDGGRLPTNASLRAIYAPSARFMGEAAMLERLGGGEVASRTVFDDAELALILTPLSPLEPSTEYVARFPSLSAIGDADTRGEGAVVRFNTAVGVDSFPPALDALEITTWDSLKQHDACSDSAPERYIFELRVAGAMDDGGPDGLGLVVFRTAGPDLGEGEPPVRVAYRPMPADGEAVVLRLPRAEGLGRICFAAVARDLVDQISAPTGEACVTTRRPPFWNGCSAAGARWPSSRVSLAGLSVVALSVIVMRATRRARRRRSARSPSGHRRSPAR